MYLDISSAAFHNLLPSSFALQHRIAPLEANNGTLRVAVCEAGSRQVLSDLEFLTGKRVESVLRSEEEVLALLKQIYGEQQPQTPGPVPTGQEFQVVEKSFEEADNGKLVKASDDTSVIKLVNQIITEAIVSGASDIHIEAYEQQFRVRYRLDGVLQERARPALEKKRAIISRLKIMADLDIAEKRRPQDGRIRVRRGEQVIDIRVSTLPTDFGEKIVLRILDKSQLNLELDKLGFEAGALSLFKNAIQSPHGMVLVTGPTGSGKTI